MNKKIFISLIPTKIEKKQLLAHFEQFGDILHLKLKKGKWQGKLVTAKLETNQESTYLAILEKEYHNLPCGTSIRVQPCLSGKQLALKEDKVACRKISVLNIKGKISKKDLREIFEAYGEVELCYHTYYKEKKTKAYGFVLFNCEKAVLMLIKLGQIEINGKLAKIKPFKMNSKKFQKRKAKAKDQINKKTQDLVRVAAIEAELIKENRVKNNVRGCSPSTSVQNQFGLFESAPKYTTHQFKTQKQQNLPRKRSKDKTLPLHSDTMSPSLEKINGVLTSDRSKYRYNFQSNKGLRFQGIYQFQPKLMFPVEKSDKINDILRKASSIAMNHSLANIRCNYSQSQKRME